MAGASRVDGEARPDHPDIVRAVGQRFCFIEAKRIFKNEFDGRHRALAEKFLETTGPLSVPGCTVGYDIVAYAP